MTTSHILDGFPAGDPRANNLGYWSHVAARNGPDALAMIDLSGERPREVSYRMLEDRLDRFAAPGARAEARRPAGDVDRQPP